jgi:hypothetical protein
MKAHFSPYCFNSFFKCCDSATVNTYYENWGRFLETQNFAVQSISAYAIDSKFKAGFSDSSNQQCILNMAVSQAKVQGCLEFHFCGGVLPSCKCGFLRTSRIRLDDHVLSQILDEKLASVIEFPVSGATKEVQIEGFAWALYLYLKLTALPGWGGWHLSNVNRSPASRVFSALEGEFGFELLKFTYPGEVETMNKWLAECDSKMKPQTEEVLSQALSQERVSIKTWRKLRP